MSIDWTCKTTSVHPSTLEVIDELGWIDDLRKLPYTKTEQVTMELAGGHSLTFADFCKLPVRHPYIAFMAQWDFLDFLAAKAADFPCFALRRNAQAVDLIRRNGQVTGVRVNTPEGPMEVTADLVVGADGRHSTVRDRAGLTPVAGSAVVGRSTPTCCARSTAPQARKSVPLQWTDDPCTRRDCGLGHSERSASQNEFDWSPHRGMPQYD